VAKNPKGPLGQAWAHRLTNIAIWTWGPRKEMPPKELDEAAVAMQAIWSYVQGAFRVYARMLDEPRREQLILDLFAASKECIAELYALAPTPRVLGALVDPLKRHLAMWRRTPADAFPGWERQMGEHARTLFDALM
jgi:hypothetical protein